MATGHAPAETSAFRVEGDGAVEGDGRGRNVTEVQVREAGDPGRREPGPWGSGGQGRRFRGHADPDVLAGGQGGRG